MQEAEILAKRRADGEMGRILVVEDERVVARDLAATLTSFGYTVVGTTATGEDAVEKARLLDPSLVLMDIHLAGEIDGIHAAELIKLERDVAVIYLTAYSDRETLSRAKGTEPQAFLLKPFKPAELRCAIEIALHKHEIEARLRSRQQWLAATLRAIEPGLVISDSAEGRALLNPISKALTGWTRAGALERSLDQILGLVAEEDEKRVDTVPLSAAEPAATVDDRLEERILERTEQLEAANRELEAFNFSVAHDLRAPLRGIDGFSQALIEDHAANLGADGVDKLERIRRASQRMARLIDDLLQLSRVARSEPDRRPVDLSRLASAVAAEFLAMEPDREVELVIPRGMRVDADEYLLRIVLENLLGNAWKFTSKRDAARIEVGQLGRDGVQTWFVRDNGAGFDMKRADKLFGAFERLHSESEFEGTGVGLAIVHRAIERHGGAIWAESAVGHGATFHFTL